MEPQGLIDLDAEASPETGVISLDNADKALLSEKVVKERAEKAHFGLKESSPGVESLSSAIARGDETYARETAASAVALKDRELRLKIIQRELDSGNTLNPNQVELIKNLSNEELAAGAKDPNTIFETEYGKEFVNRMTLAKAQEDALFNRARKTNPETTYDDMDFTSSVIARQEIARTKLQDLESRWEQMGIFSKGLDFAETMVPAKSWANVANAGTKFTDNSLITLPGETIANKVQYLWSLPPKQFEKELATTLEALSTNNMTDAIQFAQAVIGFSTSERVLNNAFGIADIFDVSVLVKAGSKAVASGLSKLTRGAASREPTQQVKKALSDAVKAAAEVPSRGERVTEVVGETDKAAVIKAVQNVAAEATEDTLPSASEKFRGIYNTIPSISKPTQVLDDIGNLTREAATRISGKLTTNAERLIDSVENVIHAQRLTPEALARAADNAKAELRSEFNRLNDSVMDVVTNPVDPSTNTFSVSMRLGDTQAMPFESLERAETWAKDMYNLSDGTWRVKQEGSNFYIDIPRSLDETTADVRKLLATTNNTAPKSNQFANLFMNKWRSPAETSSEQARANRNITALNHSNFLRKMEEFTKSFGEMKGDTLKEFNRVLTLNRDTPNPDGIGRGNYYGTIGELQQAYLKNFDRLPSETEIENYFKYVQLNDLDWSLRNFVMLRDKERQGLKKFTFEVQANHYGEYEGPKVMNPSFEGKEVPSINWQSDHLSVAVYDPATLRMQIIRRNPPSESKAMVDQMVKEQGFRIIQIADPLHRPLKEATGSQEPIQFLITKNAIKSELDPNQLGYRPGGHVVYKHDYWVKQPKLYQAQQGVKYYEGDITAFNFSTRAQAEKWAPRLDYARQLILNGQDDLLDDYASKHLPYSGSQIKELFGTDGPFDLHQPFFVAESGQKWTDFNKLDKITKNLSEGNYNLTAEVDQTFAGHRDWNALTIREAKGETEPVFNLHDAELLDPLSTISRALGQVSRSRYFGDLKIHAAESFVEEFAEALKTPLDELRKYPMYYLMKPEWNDKANRELLSRAMYTRDNAMTFIGEQTPFGQNIEWFKATMINGLEKVAGTKMAEMVSTSKLMQSRDPLAFFRGVAFHMKIGLFNPAQLFVQAQGLANIMAISPRQALPSYAGSTLMRSLMLNANEEIIESAAQKASKLGWNARQFKESWEWLNKSGWNHVGREQAILDDVTDPSLVRGVTGDILDWGTIFFKESERMVRMSSWNAAYLEWRKANPTRVITDREAGEILNRADTLSVNMTRASKTRLEQGVFSIPAQFSAYSARLIDQFMGKQLSRAEKARLMGTYAVLYGVPTSIGATVGLPLYEVAKQKSIEWGYTNNDKIATAVLEGLPSVILTAITGQEYNAAQRYGPGGFAFLRDLWLQDKGIAEVLVGPAGSTLGNIIKSTYPVIEGLSQVFKEGGSFEPVIADIIDASREISAVNGTVRMLMALNTGKYLTKNDTHLTNISGWDAIFGAITGLTPRDISDAFLMKNSLEKTEDLQKEAEKQFQKYYRRGVNEAANGNRAASDAYFNRAKAYLILGGFQPNQYSEIWNRAMSNQGSVVDRIRTDWWQKAPAGEMQKRIEQTIEMQKDAN